MDFCSCKEAPPPHEQLLEIGWWPATPDSPATAVTLQALKLFHALSLFGRLPPTDFYRALEARSNPEGLGGIDSEEDGDPIPVSDLESDAFDVVLIYSSGLSSAADGCCP